MEQEIRLRKKLAELEPGTEPYKDIQNELKMLISIRAESKESKRRISKSDRGGIIIKLLGIVGAGAGIGSVIWAESKGMIFTGEKRRFMDTISSSLGKMFFNR